MRRTILCVLLLNILPLAQLAAQTPEAPIRRLRQIPIKPRDVATGLAIAGGQYLHNPVNLLAFTPDNRTIASATFGDKVTLWDVATSAPTPARDAAHYFSAEAMQRFMASKVGVSADRVVSEEALLLRPNGPNPLQPEVFRIRDKSKRIASVPFAFTSPDGATVLTAHGTRGYEIMNSLPPLRPALPWMVCDAKTGQKRFDLADPSSPAHDIIFATEALALTDLYYGQEMQYASSPVLAWSPTGRHFVWSGRTGNALLTDAYSGVRVSS